MINKKRLAGLAGGIALAGIAAITIPQIGGEAADHNDPPQRFPGSSDANEADDIADVFAYHTDTSVRYIVTFAGPADSGDPSNYDRDVLYLINTSTDGDATDSENVIEVRFGQDTNGRSGVEVSNVPGSSGPISGPVEANIRDSANRAVQVRAGQFDDPFFFDLTGFQETIQTSTLAISNGVDDDDFARRNVNAIVIEYPRSALDPSIGGIEVWAQTRRIS